MVLTERRPDFESEAEPDKEDWDTDDVGRGVAASATPAPETNRHEQETRLRELRDELQRGNPEASVIEPKEQIANLRKTHGEYVTNFLPSARIRLADEELGKAASGISKITFALRRRFRLLPEGDLQRLAQREAELLTQLVREEREAFLNERQPAETRNNPAETITARHLAAPDIRTVLTRGEHDAEQERHRRGAA